MQWCKLAPLHGSGAGVLPDCPARYCPSGRVQVVKYNSSEFYAEHYDNKAGSSIARAATIIIYLNDVQVRTLLLPSCRNYRCVTLFEYLAAMHWG